MLCPNSQSQTDRIFPPGSSQRPQRSGVVEEWVVEDTLPPSWPSPFSYCSTPGPTRKAHDHRTFYHAGTHPPLDHSTTPLLHRPSTPLLHRSIHPALSQCGLVRLVPVSETSTFTVLSTRSTRLLGSFIPQATYGSPNLALAVT